MNANTIITDKMSLAEKLDAIDKAMAEMQAKHKIDYPGDAPLDPSELLACDGCQ